MSALGFSLISAEALSLVVKEPRVRKGPPVANPLEAFVRYLFSFGLVPVMMVKVKSPLRSFFLVGLLSLVWAHGGHYLPASGPGAADFKPPRTLPSVELRSHENKAFVFPPKGPAVVLFGYTQCPDACPLTLGRLLPAYEALGAPPHLQLLLLSVDERDTPQTLQKYLRGFVPVQGLTGKPEAIRPIAEAARVEYNLAPGGRLVFHTDAMALLDAQGRLVRMLYGVSRLSTAKLKEEIAQLLR